MKRFSTSALAASYLLCGLLMAALGKQGRAAADEPSALEADHDFVQAAAKGDTATVGKFLDTEFTWTNTEGRTYSRADVLSSLPKPALGCPTLRAGDQTSTEVMRFRVADRPIALNIYAHWLTSTYTAALRIGYRN